MSSARTTEATRKAELSKIHIAKKQLGWDDDFYRTTIRTISKGVTDSAGDLNHAQRATMLRHMSACGFKARHAIKSATPKPLAKQTKKVSVVLSPAEQHKKIRALWLSLHDMGAVRNPNESALLAYVMRQTRIEALNFLSVEQASDVIEALKKWQERAWMQPVMVQWNALVALGVVRKMPAHAVRSAMIKMCGVDLYGFEVAARERVLSELAAWHKRILMDAPVKTAGTTHSNAVTQ